MNDPSRENDQGTTRRGFLKGATLGTLATVGLRGLGGCGDTTEAAAPVTTAKWTWDQEADVVVVGSGCGLMAGLAAAAAGAKVIVLEKSADVGGSTKMSGGVLWIPDNPVMKRAGINDSREDALKYMQLVAKGQADDELIAAFLDRGPEMVDFLEKKNTTLKWRVSTMLGDYHPEWPGGLVKGRSIEPDAGGLVDYGPQLIGGLADAFKAAGGTVLTSSPAKRLATSLNDDGTLSVLGVVATSGGKTINIKANKGVILAAGGYDWDFEMKKHFLRGPSHYTLGHPGNEGDGIRMGQAVGAALRNMNEAWGATVYKADTEALHAKKLPGVLMAMMQRRGPSCITVNRYGARFGNEASDYNSAWRTYFGWENWGQTADHNLPAFQISDANMPPLADSGIVQADTLEELATKLGIDAAGLAATVKAFNEGVQAADGPKDPAFHRGESQYDNEYGDTLGTLIAAPFYGVEVAPADLGTCGGVQVNANAQALDAFGTIIQGLYASGNNAGVGGPGAGYGGGGGTIGPAMTFAYIAGQHAASVALTPTATGA